MQKQPLETLFSAMYRNKYDFFDFASGLIEPNFVRHSFTKHGKNRQVVSPNQKLKDYHNFARLFLLDFLPFNENVVYSYRRGMSAYDAVKKHTLSKHFFACDIANFFTSLKRSRIERVIRTGLDVCPIVDARQWAHRFLDLVCVDGVLPTGFATSPTISNAALLNFDNELHQYCMAVSR